MERTNWVERVFSFDFPEGILPNVIERLQGTELRLIDMTKGISEEDATFKPDGKWSIKEQVGHLLDLEDLHINRLKEFIDHKTELSPADMKNAKTEEANHNASELSFLIQNFSKKRNEFINLLLSMDDETQLFTSLHPRLKTPMRPVDVAFFTAEHDDHHLASAREVLEKINR